MEGRGCAVDWRPLGLTLTGLLAAGLGLWTGCSETSLSVSYSDPPSYTVFQDLARLEVTSDHLSQAIMEQADSAGYSHQLELQSNLDGPLTEHERALIEQSFVRSLKVMLFDLAPTGFWEDHLAAYYASMLSEAEAQKLVDAYEQEVLTPSSRLRLTRESFLRDRLPTLLPVVRTRSQMYEIPGDAMVPTLLPGDHVIVHRVAYEEAAPQQGDVVVYRYPDREGKRFLHRVIGIPGDQIEIRDQVVSVNGEALTEPYIQHTDRSSMAGNPRDNLGPVTVPPDTYFVLGDNREESLDSRFFGPISKEHLLGRVLFIYWSVDPRMQTPRWERLNQLVR